MTTWKIRMAIYTLEALFAFIGGITLYGSLGTKALSEDKGETGTNGKEVIITDE